MHGPQSVYQNSQASSGDVKIHGTSGGDIHRRRASHGILQRFPYGLNSFDPVSPREHWICNQREEVSTGTHSGNRISWNDHQLQGDGHKLIRLKDQEYQARRTETSQPPKPFSQSLSHLIGKLNTTTRHSRWRPSFCRALHTCLKQALEVGSQDYQSPVQLSTQAKEDLQWWELYLSNWNGRSLISQQSSMTIISDASLQGWGAFCNGVRTRGQWFPQEQTLHINCLELLAASLAVRTFAKERSGITILLKIDNTTAVAYINRMGGTASPMLWQLTKDLWLWCMERNILLQAQHLPGALNSIADRESRTWSDRSEWKLNPIVFRNINLLLGPLSTDLFGSRLSTQLPSFVSWKPDPLAMPVDAFTVDWGSISGKLYANPPWNLVARVLSQVLNRRVEELVLVAPVWKAQSWYPVLLQLLINKPLLIPQSPLPIQSVCQNRAPDIMPPISCVSCIRDRCQNGKLSNAATDLVPSSWRDKSMRSYNSFNKWACWCAEQERNPISGPISDVANFLAYLFEEGYQYRSINVYRSSISTTHDKVDGYSVGQHPTVTRLMRGVFNKRPPLSKYSYTWDVHKVTSYISNLDEMIK